MSTKERYLLYGVSATESVFAIWGVHFREVVAIRGVHYREVVAIWGVRY